MPMAVTTLDRSLTAFVTGPVAINLAAHDAALTPSIARGYGCKVSADGRRITVFVSVQSSAALARDLRAGAPIAVVFCRPHSHATLQFKSTAATLVALAADDRDIMRAYAKAFGDEIISLGFQGRFTASLVAAAEEDAVGVEFTPTAVFDQTPGPEAGKPLELAS